VPRVADRELKVIVCAAAGSEGGLAGSCIELIVAADQPDAQNRLAFGQGLEIAGAARNRQRLSPSRHGLGQQRKSRAARLRRVLRGDAQLVRIWRVHGVV
jgi:hypothetical protein